MKKFLSLALALVMICSLSVSAFAYNTEVSYTGSKTTVDPTTGAVTYDEYYEVTVPATLQPGGSGKVTAEGFWPSSRKLTVSCPESVVLTCNIDNSTKTLTVAGGDIALVGSNTAEVSAEKTVSIGEIADAVFGVWEGSITYTVSMGAA